MKEIILTTIITLSTVLITSAQFDDRFYFPSKEWNKIENVQFEEFYFNIETDTLNAILFTPEEKPKATILFYHGSGGNISNYTFITDPLVKAGYQVFAVDFRGYGKSTGTPTHLNIASDAQFVFDNIIEKDGFKDLPIIIYGASLGTQIATKMAKDNQNKIAGLILDGTISSFTDMALLSASEEQKLIISQYVTSPYSSINDIKDIENLPKLFIHSKEDKVVPFTQGEAVFNKAQEPKELWKYEGSHLEAVEIFPELFIQKINNIVDLSEDNSKNTIKITLNGLRNNNGKIMLTLEDLSGNKVASTSETIANKQSLIIINNITSGKYTISYFHDENNNKELDSKFGIPKEGYGFSNNAKGKFGPPSLEKRTMVITNSKSIILTPEYLNF
jgi:uncharacterized protein